MIESKYIQAGKESIGEFDLNREYPAQVILEQLDPIYQKAGEEPPEVIVRIVPGLSTESDLNAYPPFKHTTVNRYPQTFQVAGWARRQEAIKGLPIEIMGLPYFLQLSLCNPYSYCPSTLNNNAELQGQIVGDWAFGVGKTLNILLTCASRENYIRIEEIAGLIAEHNKNTDRATLAMHIATLATMGILVSSGQEVPALFTGGTSAIVGLAALRRSRKSLNQVIQGSPLMLLYNQQFTDSDHIQLYINALFQSN